MTPVTTRAATARAAAQEASTSCGLIGAPQRCQSGGTVDETSLDVRDELVRLLPRLRRFARSLTRDDETASDLVQETCARALGKLHLWQTGTRFDSWLFRIAQNLWLDKVRARRTRGEMIDIDSAHDVIGSDGRQVTESRLTMEEVARGLDTLTPDQQVVIALVCIDGMTYKEAAETLELPIGTVMSRLGRARLALDVALNGGK
jgi:RNA polymerase sigma-70 factor, ECF subfamily